MQHFTGQKWATTRVAVSLRSGGAKRPEGTFPAPVTKSNLCADLSSLKLKPFDPRIPTVPK